MLSQGPNIGFDVNILENYSEDPNIELSFPLPTDKDTYVDLEANEKVANTWSILQNFIKFTTGVDWDSIYHPNEYTYSINKYSSAFNTKMANYMKDRLENSDEKLDECVDSLVNQEIRLNLIQGKDYVRRFKEVKEFMVKYYTQENEKNLPKFMTRSYMRVCYLTIMSLMKKMFPNGIWCSREEFSKLHQKYLENPMSIIFLPNHQSHIDYIILHLVAIRFQLSTPTVIAGENLNVAVFGSILKGLGAIFIKRSFNNEMYTERNLANFIEFTLLNKIHFEVFIEGTRSRDGKLLLPKYGILKTLANIYIKQREEEGNDNFDMLMLPVSISYERIYEADGYLSELMGKDKVKESGATIFKNGLRHFFGGSEGLSNINEDYDNSTRHLHGKIYIKLGNFFSLSDFIESDLKSASDMDLIPGSKVNLKKLGYKVLHEINRCSFLPKISIIGAAIQTHYNLYKRQRFDIYQLVPIMRLLIEAFKEEESENIINMSLLESLSSSSDKELVEMTREQMPHFLREIKVNLKTNEIIIKDSMELLYYKNLTVHVIVHKALASFILLSLTDNMRNANILHKMFYIFTGFLKHEFLFDYDYNDKHKLSNILKSLVANGKIERVFPNPNSSRPSYKIIDYHYLNCFSEIIKPFIESYSICIYHLNNIITKFNEEHGFVDFKKLAIDDTGIDYPHTKSLFKAIQSNQDSKSLNHIESTNKQYLMSCLYYINNLQLIEIIKNKRRTKAFVLISNGKDLHFIYTFLNTLLRCSTQLGAGDDNDTINEISVGYMIDIIDKNFERDPEELVTSTENFESGKLVDVSLKSKF
ncbi:hypothetical protein CLIB1423_23S01596 [[Candida] railenensis]|uniref:Phospholipid/glycerol acyltransferase domain-containing protein n=1 Tax=[Candida] railenensis TaxID=45579 RepID=A0A9P0QVU3_9ASCO|nr:hypothetical protein CLIB1423_23S01596 [[Candida] railenensis]